MHQILILQNSNGNVYAVCSYHKEDNYLHHDAMLFINAELILHFKDQELANGTMYRQIQHTNSEYESLIYN
jgi:hypothetical protein